MPDILLLDLQMKKVHGRETAEWITNNAPAVKIIVLAITVDDKTILEMIKAGAKGYLSKDSPPAVLFDYIEGLCQNEIFFSETITSKLILGLQRSSRQSEENLVPLTDNEKLFLWYLCHEFTHSEIAKKMFLSPRTIDDYSNRLTKKLNVRSKSGLIVYAVTHRLHLGEDFKREIAGELER